MDVWLAIFMCRVARVERGRVNDELAASFCCCGMVVVISSGFAVCSSNEILTCSILSASIIRALRRRAFRISRVPWRVPCASRHDMRRVFVRASRYQNASRLARSASGVCLEVLRTNWRLVSRTPPVVLLQQAWKRICAEKVHLRLLSTVWHHFAKD